jgi:hypothetical protein
MDDYFNFERLFMIAGYHSFDQHGLNAVTQGSLIALRTIVQRLTVCRRKS